MNLKTKKVIYVNDLYFPALEVRRNIHYGIELEYEHIRMDGVVDVPPMWHVVPDGSLRHNGLELVSRPLPDNTVNHAISRLTTFLRKYCPSAVASVRCGGHVHLNVSDLSVQQVLNIAQLYMLGEWHIFSKYAPARTHSAFCVPLTLTATMQTLLTTTQSALVDIKNPLTSDWGFGVLKQCSILNHSKYASVNFAAMHRHGTLEFRIFPSSLDAEEIQSWCSLLKRIRNLASEYDTPANIWDHYKKVGSEKFLKQYVPVSLEADRFQARSERAARRLAGAAEVEKYREKPPKMDWKLNKDTQGTVNRNRLMRTVVYDTDTNPVPMEPFFETPQPPEETP